MAASKWAWFYSGDQNLLEGSELTWFSCGGEKFLVLVCRSKLNCILCGSIGVDLILEWGSNWLDFSTGVEIISIFVWGVEFDLVTVLGWKVKWFLCGGSKLTVCGPKLTCFECDDRLTCFLCGRWWSKLTRFLHVGRKSLGFSVNIKVDLVSVWLVDIDLVSVSEIELDFIRDRNWFVVAGGRKWLGFSIWIEIGLVWWCSTANRYGVLTYRCVCYVLEDHSVNVDLLAQWFLLYKQAEEARASNSSQGWLSSSVVYPL